jgi:hypothetical protein
MAQEKKYPLSLIIRAVDNATGTLKAINKEMANATKPVRKLNNSLVSLSAEAGFPRIFKGVKGVGSAIGNVASEAAGLGLKLAALTGGAALGLFAFAKSAVNAGDELATVAQRVGLTVDAYAQLQFAAAQADVEQESFARSMDVFTKQVGEAKAGTGTLYTFLQKINPALARQVRGSKNSEEALRLMTGAFERVTDPGKRAALAAAAFGRSGLQMGQFLGQGSKAIEEQRQRYLALAGSQAKFVAGAGDLDNVMRETETAFLGVRSAIFAELAPGLTELAKGITSLISENRGDIVTWAREAGAALLGWVKGGGLRDIVSEIKSLGATIGPIIQQLGGVKAIAAGAGLVLGGPLLSSIGGLISALATLGPAAATPAGLALLAVASVAGRIIANWGPIKTFFADLFGSIRENAGGLRDFFVGVFTGDFSRAWDGIKSVASAAVDFIATLLDGFIALAEFSLSPILEPLGWAASALGIELPKVATFRELVGTGAAAVPTGAPTGAAAALPGLAGAQAELKVSFDNMPRGARVQQTSSVNTDLAMDLGYAMSVPD